MQLFLFLIEVGVVLFRQIAVSRKREPTARFAYANANDGKLRLPRRFRSGTLI